MNDFWKTVLSSAGLSVVLSGAIVVLLRTWISTRIKSSIEHEYNEKLEEIKSRLQGELEGTKAGYKKALDEHQIRFSHLHAARADVIKELYSRLVEMERLTKEQIDSLGGGGTEQNKDPNRTALAINALNGYYRPNRILLRGQECELIEKLHKIAKDTFVAYAKDANSEGYSESLREEWFNKLVEAEKRMRDDFRDLKERLEKEFRIAMGVIDDHSTETETKE